MEVSNSSSFYDVEPSSQMDKSYNQVESPEDRAIQRYNELYVRDQEKLSIFENYIKNRVTESAYLWGKNEEKRKLPMIARRRQNFPPYATPGDMTNSMIGENGSKTPDYRTKDSKFYQTEEEVLTPRGVINAFLLKDPTQKLNKGRGVSADPVPPSERPKMNARNFFFNRKRSDAEIPSNANIDELKPERPADEKPEKSDRPKSALKKSHEVKDTSKLKVREVENDTSNTRANDSTGIYLKRPQSRVNILLFL